MEPPARPRALDPRSASRHGESRRLRLGGGERKRMAEGPKRVCLLLSFFCLNVCVIFPTEMGLCFHVLPFCLKLDTPIYVLLVLREMLGNNVPLLVLMGIYH